MSIADYVVVNVLLEGAAPPAAGFGVPCFVNENTVDTDRLQGPFSSLSDLVDAGFATSDPMYLWATALMSQRPRPSRFYSGRIDALDATLTDSLTAIVAAGPGNFYAFNLESKVDADLEDLAAYVETLQKIAIVQSSSSTMLAGTAGNIGETLSGLTYNRTALIYHDDDTEYLDGAWTGRCLAFDLDAEKGAGTWHGKSLQGVPGANLTGAQRTQLAAYNANMYAPVVFSSGVEQDAFTSFGTMVSGRYIDLQTTMDWVHARSEEALLGVTLRTPTKNPYTDTGMALYQAAVLGVLERGGRALHFANGTVSPVTGRRTPWVDVPKIADVSSADKQARRLRMDGEVIVAGAIHTIVNFTLYANL